ncbi:hypothetical protein D3C86_1813390 [compost metagenome]
MFVQVQEAQPVLLEAWVALVDAEAEADQSTGAVAGDRAHRFVRLRRQAFFGQQAVEGGAQVAGGVGQGAVKVKQYGLDHDCCSLR